MNKRFKDNKSEANVKTKKRRKRHVSIMWKIFAIVSFSLILLLIITWLANTFVLEAFYKREKKDMLGENFSKINTLMSDINDSSKTQLNEHLYKMETNYNIQVSVQNSFGMWYSLSTNQAPMQALPSQVYIPENQPYVIENIFDERSNSEIIALIGAFDNNTKVIMTTPLAPIKESVSVTNQFLLISGGFSLLLALVTVFFLTKSFTKPITNLTSIAKQMSRLDFTTKHKVKGGDEISQLGDSMNVMSETLEESISNLKNANARLVYENKLKTQQNEAHKAFISNVSHELKTPLALMQSYAENLRENIDKDTIDTEYYYRVIEDEAEKMNMMIRKMTMLMQLQSGKEELVIENFDIVELANNLLRKHTSTVTDKEFNVELILDKEGLENPVLVKADPFLVEHVIINYVTNATHHVDDGGIIKASLLIVPSQDKNASNRVRVSVYNSGSHVPTEDMSKLFDNFYKVDKARTRSYGGAGIGLSVVSAIMEAHGMSYGVSYGVSNKDGGVEFFFELEAI